MYQIPRWRYWLVGIVFVVGLLLAIPNFFGEDDAIQLSRDDRAVIAAADQERIVSLLKEKQLANRAVYIEGDRLVLRFGHVDEQLRARDVIRDETKGEYVIALTSVSRTPAWLRRFGLKPMSLGL